MLTCIATALTQTCPIKAQSGMPTKPVFSCPRPPFVMPKWCVLGAKFASQSISRLSLLPAQSSPRSTLTQNLWICVRYRGQIIKLLYVLQALWLTRSSTFLFTNLKFERWQSLKPDQSDFVPQNLSFISPKRFCFYCQLPANSLFHSGDHFRAKLIKALFWTR